MSLVTRVSVAFLVALALALGGFSAMPVLTLPGCACGSPWTRSWRRRWTASRIAPRARAAA